jgi:hypothetical protein
LKRALILNQISTPRDILSNVEKLFNTSQLGQKCLSEIDMILESLGIESNLSTTYQKRILKPKTKSMKIELIKDTDWDGDVWYGLYKNGAYITGSRKLDEMQEMYKEATDNPQEFFKARKQVLLSAEIDVSSNKTT